VPDERAVNEFNDECFLGWINYEVIDSEALGSTLS
jgi:hypothetical protein